MHAVVAVFLLQHYSPLFDKEAPRWVYYLSAYLLFIYQVQHAAAVGQISNRGAPPPN